MTDLIATPEVSLKDRRPTGVKGVDPLRQAIAIGTGRQRNRPQDHLSDTASVTLTTTRLPIDTFIGFKENPKQRDTQRHADMASRHHLRQFSPAQARVSVALFDAQYYKLDGHTRAHLWATGALKRPDALHVDVYHCSELNQLLDLYDTFDNKRAAETTADRLSGALKLAGVEVHSHALKRYGFTSCFSVMVGHYVSGQELPRCVKAYADEIRALDGIDPTVRLFRPGVIAGSLLLLSKYGVRIEPFLRAFNSNQGIKFAQECDGVQALYELVTQVKTRGGWGDITTLARRTVSCGERWMAGENYRYANGRAQVKDTHLTPYIKKLG